MIIAKNLDQILILYNATQRAIFFSILLLLFIITTPQTCFADGMLYDVELAENKIKKNLAFKEKNIAITGKIVSDKVDNIIVTIQGPKKSYQIWRKEKKYGIWANGSRVIIPFVDSFVHTYTSQNLYTILSPRVIDLLELDPNAISIKEIETNTDYNTKDFSQAFHTNQIESQLYLLANNTISITPEGAFQLITTFPESIIKGTYHISLYGTKNNIIVDSSDLLLEVEDSGISNSLRSLALDSPIYYSILGIFLCLLISCPISYFLSRTSFRFKR